MADPKYFMVYFDCKQHIDMLSDQQAGQLFKALFEFAVSGKKTGLSDGMVKMAFSFMTAQIKRDLSSYHEKCEKNRLNALKRWDKNVTAYGGIQSEATLCQKCQEKEEEKEKEKEKKEEDILPDKSARPPKPVKHKFGEYGHVKLTDDEYNRLCEDFGIETTDLYVRKIDEYLQMTGRKSYSDYNLTVRKWLDKDNIRKRSNDYESVFRSPDPNDTAF